MGGKYERGLYRQFEEALIKIEELTTRVQRIEQETANKYLAIIYKQDERIKQLEAEVAAKDIKIAALEAEVDRLRKIINNNSGNSSAAPSRDQKPNKPPRANSQNLRMHSGKHTGGQEGHPGKALTKQEAENLLASGKAVHRVIEHGRETSGRRYVTKYVLDVQMQTVVLEHRFYADESGRIEIPVEYRADVQYGAELKAMTVGLYGQGIVSSNRIVQFVSELSRGAIKISEGTFYNFLEEFGRKCKGEVESIRERILSAPIMYIDETGVRCEKKGMFFRNYSTPELVLYTVNPRRGKAAIADDGILTQYIGTLIHDHNTVDYNYGSRHGECNVHLLRYLKSVTENSRNTWAADMAQLLVTANNTKKIAQAYEQSIFEDEQLGGYASRYDAILTEGFAQAKTTKSKVYKEDELKLLRRLKKYKANHLLFLYDFMVPFDNNLSERDLRLIKTKVKVSGCFRRLHGARLFADLQTIIRSSAKIGLNILDSIRCFFPLPLPVG